MEIPSGIDYACCAECATSWLDERRYSVSRRGKARYTSGVREVTLPGGRTTGAVLIGAVVHKPASPWTPTVHALLRHLQACGFDAAPRALGFDEQGREMLTYLPGDTIGDRVPWPGWVFADPTLVQVGRWLRRVHDLSVDFTPPAHARWFTGTTTQPGWIIGHQDAAPYNAVMDGDRLVGFFDWDIASPSSREVDIALSALLWVPLTAPGAGQPFDAVDPAERFRRVHLFLDAYGYHNDRRAFAVVIPQRARRQAAVIHRMAEAGDPASTALLFFANLLQHAASHVESLPDAFWTA